MKHFVDVYDKKTGKKQKVPPHYLDNPVLMRPFSRTPKSKAADQAAASSTTTSTSSTSSDAGTPSAPATHRTTETRAPGDKE